MNSNNDDLCAAHLVDHVTLRMPTLIPHVTVNLHELLQDGGIAPDALRREPRAVVIMAVDVARVLVVRILGAEECGADRASEVVDVVFFVCIGSERV